MNDENLKETETYKYLLKITEDLLVNGGYPSEILNKYYSLKEITLSKIKTNTSNNNNKFLALNEANDLSFNNNQMTEKDFEFINTIFNSIYSSICGIKANFIQLNFKECKNSNEKNLQSCLLKPMIFSENVDQNKNLIKVLKEQYEKFLEIFSEIEEISKANLEELKHYQDYVKDLETHIKEIEIIEKKDENDVQSEQEHVDYPSEHKKLMDNLVTMQITCESYKEKIQNLDTQIIQNQEQYTGIIDDLQNKNQYLELKYDDILKETLERDTSKNILEDFEKNFYSIFEKFSNMKENFLEQTPTKYPDENIRKFKFLKFLIEKFEDDNMWLIGKLKELTQENTELDRKLQIYEQQSNSTIFIRKGSKNIEIANVNYEAAENQIRNTLDETRKILQKYQK